MRERLPRARVRLLPDQICIGPMPKMKTNSGAKKRFRRTTSGRLKRAKAFRSHILTKKSTKRKRALGKKTLVDARDQARIGRLVGA